MRTVPPLDSGKSEDRVLLPLSGPAVDAAEVGAQVVVPEAHRLVRREDDRHGRHGSRQQQVHRFVARLRLSIYVVMVGRMSFILAIRNPRFLSLSREEKTKNRLGSLKRNIFIPTGIGPIPWRHST